MKTIIVGLGNPILGDDGVGWKVIENISQNLRADASVGIECLSLGGLGLMERLIGYDRAIVVDSFIAEKEEIGSILTRNLNDLPNYSAFHITSAHDTSLQNAIELGRRMGAYLPNEIIVIGVAIRTIREFSEELSPPVAEAVQKAARMALGLLKQPVINL